jgi:dTDP-4-dehydrorhamnose 3,5-epimerase
VNRLTVTDLPLAGLRRVERQRLGDARGFFTRLFCAEELRSAGWVEAVAQINHTMTARRGTVRGMHFQRPPHAEMKLVSCIRGEVFDVAVDLRRGSPTFLRWHAEPLAAGNNRALLIPQGFAHGFQALTDDAELIYCHSAAYDAAAEGCLNPRDARLAIAWPLPIVEMSARDESAPMLDETFSGVAP